MHGITCVALCVWLLSLGIMFSRLIHMKWPDNVPMCGWTGRAHLHASAGGRARSPLGGGQERCLNMVSTGRSPVTGGPRPAAHCAPCVPLGLPPPPCCLTKPQDSHLYRGITTPALQVAGRAHGAVHTERCSWMPAGCGFPAQLRILSLEHWEISEGFSCVDLA